MGDAEYGSYLEEVKQLASALDVDFEPKVRIDDNELVELMNRARMLVYAARLEPFGLVTLESNACGTPVVVTAEGGMRETVINGINGIMVDPDPAAMADAIRLLMQNGRFAHRLGKNGASLVQQQWTLDAAIDRLEYRFSQALAHRAQTSARGAARQIAISCDRLPARLIAFYQPTFYASSEATVLGDEAGGWTSLLRAKPSVPGQNLPHLPTDLGFYDLRSPDVRQAQADLARQYGIYGFCYYHYWHNGQALYARPVDEMLASGKPDFPFCLCWKNGSEAGHRGGQSRASSARTERLLDDDQAHVEWLVRSFNDPRYIRINGRPLFLVYRVDLLTDPAKLTEILRAQAEKAGLPGLYLCVVASLPLLSFDPAVIGFDAVVEFPPTGMAPPLMRQVRRPDRSHVPPALRDLVGLVKPRISNHTGNVYDYPLFVDAMVRQRWPAYTLFPGVVPSWDDSLRHTSQPSILHNCSPDWYGRWLHHAITVSRQQFVGDERLVFVNSWNDWAVGSQLEPDQYCGRGRLESTLAVLASFTAQDGGV